MNLSYRNSNLISIMNSITISGHLGKDAEVREFNENILIKFSIAHNYKVGESEKTLWLTCELWRQGKEVAKRTASFLKKGRKVGIVGQLMDDSYMKDNQKVNAVKIKVDRFYLLDSNTQQSQDQPQEQQQEQTQNTKKTKEKKKKQEEEVDLPF